MCPTRPWERSATRSARARVAGGGCQCRRRAAGGRRRASPPYQRSAVECTDGPRRGRARRKGRRRAPRPRPGRTVRPPARRDGVIAAFQSGGGRAASSSWRVPTSFTPISTARSPLPDQLRLLKTARAPRHGRTRRTDARPDIDLSRDTVVVVGPTASRRGSGLTVAAVHTPTCLQVCCGRRRAVAPGLSMSPTSPPPCSTCWACPRPTTWKGT